MNESAIELYWGIPSPHYDEQENWNLSTNKRPTCIHTGDQRTPQITRLYPHYQPHTEIHASKTPPLLPIYTHEPLCLPLSHKTSQQPSARILGTPRWPDLAPPTSNQGSSEYNRNHKPLDHLYPMSPEENTTTLQKTDSTSNLTHRHPSRTKYTISSSPPWTPNGAHSYHPPWLPFKTWRTGPGKSWKLLHRIPTTYFDTTQPAGNQPSYSNIS